ncbi:MAG: hypothetical protein ACTSVI_17145 [Promethearchaeota archaeon]
MRRSKNIVTLFLVIAFAFNFLMVEALAIDTKGSFHKYETYLAWGGTNAESASQAKYDGKGFIYVVGTTNTYGTGGYDAFLLKYEISSNNVSWYKTWGTAGNENGTAIAYDDVNDEIYISVADSLVKFDENGDVLWNESFSGISIIYAIDIDDNGNVIFCGKNNKCLDVIKILSNGSQLWRRSIYLWGEDGSSLDNDGASLGVDSNGNIYMIASKDLRVAYGSPLSYATVGCLQFFKYDSEGNLEINETLKGGSSATISGYSGYISYLGADINVHSTNEIYFVVCEHLHSVEPLFRDGTFYYKKDSLGNEMVSYKSIYNYFSNPWADMDEYGNFDPYEEELEPSALEVDSKNMYIVGEYRYTSNVYGFFLWEYDLVNGGARTLFFDDKAHNVANDVVSCGGSVYVIGSCKSGTNQQALIVKYSQSTNALSSFFGNIPGFDLFIMFLGLGIVMAVIVIYRQRNKNSGKAQLKIIRE